MQTLTLNAEARTIRGRKNYALRENLQIPAVVYGPDMASTMITVGNTDFARTLRSAGESTLIDLVVAGAAPVKVLIGEVQRDPIRHDITHIDFRQVNMNKPIDAKIALNFIGESAAVKALGGTLVKALEDLEVRCLPGKLVHSIDIDLSKLATFEDNIAVRDLVIPEGMEVLTDADVTVALVEAPRSEEEMAALDAAVDTSVDKVEVVEKKGKEETAAEGEAPAAAPEAK